MLIFCLTSINQWLQCNLFVWAYIVSFDCWTDNQSFNWRRGWVLRERTTWKLSTSEKIKKNIKYEVVEVVTDVNDNGKSYPNVEWLPCLSSTKSPTATNPFWSGNLLFKKESSRSNNKEFRSRLAYPFKFYRTAIILIEILKITLCSSIHDLLLQKVRL